MARPSGSEKKCDPPIQNGNRKTENRNRKTDKTDTKTTLHIQSPPKECPSTLPTNRTKKRRER